MLAKVIFINDKGLGYHIYTTITEPSLGEEWSRYIIPYDAKMGGYG